MDRGFFISGVAGDMTAHKLNNIAHNLANANTTGYMLDRTAFSSKLANVQGVNQNPTKMAASYMTMDRQFISDQKGIMRQTGNDLDFAIQGKAYFKVLDESTPEKSTYTRAGNFHLDGEGTLITEGGLKVLDDSDTPITIPRGVVSVNEKGDISVSNGDKITPVSRLGLHELKSMDGVHKVSGTVLTTEDANVQDANASVTVRQGMLEGSNVNSVLLMVEMMQNTRSNQSMIKVLEQYNQQEGEITQKVGRLG